MGSTVTSTNAVVRCGGTAGIWAAARGAVAANSDTESARERIEEGMGCLSVSGHDVGNLDESYDA
jgi:hypothetical protein